VENHTVPPEMRWVHQYFLASDTEAEVKASREKFRSLLKPYLMDNMEPDDRGNYLWEFDNPLTSVSGTVYSGIMAQRRITEYTDEEIARDLIKKHSLEDRCINKIVVEQVDYNELYAANQEGLISDEEIDSILYTEEAYSLVKVKA
jgi:hypothetical protein